MERVSPNLLIIAVFIVSLSQTGVEGNENMGNTMNSKFVSANTDFAFRLYAELTKQTPGINIFASPCSIALCLSMAYNGAEGETQRAMAQTLRVSGLGLDELNAAYAQLKTILAKSDRKVEIDIANSLWARRGVSFNPQFLDINKRFYDAQVSDLNFDDPTALGTINSWVRNHTNGKIDKIIDSISQDSVLFLINAIYFKGQWTKEFDKTKTREEAFTSGNGATKRRPMMRQRGTYRYLEDENFQAVSLPYGQGRLSMYIFLPSTASSLNQFSKTLTAANWTNWINQFEETEGDIVLPRFKVDYDITLNDVLKALGMEVAFDPNRADFSGILKGSRNVFISKVKHKAFAEVNEEGTEAAAATSTEIQIVSMVRPSKTFHMVVNRPFFFAIRDNTSGAILFMGSVLDPQ